MTGLTEEEVVFAFASAWNRLDPDGFLALLSPDARYASQWVFEELVGVSAISDYLRSKMKTVRTHSVNDPNSRVRVEIGRTAHGDGGRPCAFMTQGHVNEVQAAVLFEINDGKVSRYDLCIPQILGAVRTGVFPISEEIKVKHVIDSHQRVDCQALMRALPVSGLEPQCLASVGGFIDVPKDRRWQETIALLEPPEGRRVPYIEPVGALEKILRRQGVALEAAKARAIEAVARMKADVAENHWINFFDDLEPESPECLALPEFVAWLRRDCTRGSHHGLNDLASEEILVAPDILDFFEQASEVAATTPIFRGPDNWAKPWSLQDLPALPTPKSMIEFIPGPPWNDLEIDWETQDNPFLQWREAMRPIAQELESALGKAVYYFKELGDDLDDDDVHRFLVLHWCCTYKPESAFVRFLLKVSGAKDVEELKAALIDPASYTHPFEMNSAFVGMESLSCRLTYLPPDTHKTVGVVFLTEQAIEVAQSLLAQQIGAHAFIVAPKELATDAWVKHATRYCRDWTVLFLYDSKLDRPIEILASIDEIFVLANEPRPKSGFDLMLSEQSEDLLWLALNNGVDVHYYSTDGMSLYNPDTCLQKRGVPERVASQQAQRAAFTRQLKEIRLDNDFGSSGLWDDKGKMLGYDLLDLPLPLFRRIAAWQRDYDDTMNPPDMGDEAWWEHHEQEAISIAMVLQAALGASPVVKLYRKDGWLSVADINQTQGGKP